MPDNAATQNEIDFLNIALDGFATDSVQAVKKLLTTIETLQSEKEELKGYVAELETQVSDLRSDLSFRDTEICELEEELRIVMEESV